MKNGIENETEDGERAVSCRQRPSGSRDARGSIVAKSRSFCRIADQSVECLSTLESVPTEGRVSLERWAARSPEQTPWRGSHLSRNDVPRSTPDPQFSDSGHFAESLWPERESERIILTLGEYNALDVSE